MNIFRAALLSSIISVSLGSQAAVAQPEVFVGGNNHVVSNNCEPIKNLKVTIHATQDIVGPLGLGFQLNATAPTPTTYDREHPQDPTPGWQQYMIGIGPQPGINFAINLWHLKQLPNSPLLINIPSTIFYHGVGIVLPANDTLTITLGTSGDDVVAVNFSVQDGSGKPATTVPLPLVLLPGAHRIVTAFQINLVGPTGGQTISKGAGWIEYAASSSLTASNKVYPSNYPVNERTKESCVAVTTLTGENSNVAYDPIVKGPDNTLVQTFYVPQRPGSDWGNPVSNPPACVAPSKYDYQQQRCSTGGTDAYDQAPQTVGQPVETQQH
jgi:hypothetical protein